VSGRSSSARWLTVQAVPARDLTDAELEEIWTFYGRFVDHPKTPFLGPSAFQKQGVTFRLCTLESMVPSITNPNCTVPSFPESVATARSLRYIEAT